MFSRVGIVPVGESFRHISELASGGFGGVVLTLMALESGYGYSVLGSPYSLHGSCHDSLHGS